MGMIRRSIATKGKGLIAPLYNIAIVIHHLQNLIHARRPYHMKDIICLKNYKGEKLNSLQGSLATKKNPGYAKIEGGSNRSC